MRPPSAVAEPTLDNLAAYLAARFYLLRLADRMPLATQKEIRQELSSSKTLLTFNNILSEAQALKRARSLGLLKCLRLASMTRKALLAQGVPAPEARNTSQRLWVALI